MGQPRFNQGRAANLACHLSYCPGHARVFKRHLIAFSSVNLLSIAFLFERAGLF